MLVAIDGTAGSGKSATAVRVAETAGFVLMDSGLMYRAVAWVCIEHGTEILEPELVALLASVPIAVHHRGLHMYVTVDGVDITDRLRALEVTGMASRVAQFAVVRRFLFAHQRGFGRRYADTPGLVAEGRDMGTVVFPHADLKFFFDAPVEVRAERRWEQLRELGIRTALPELRASLLHRDRADRQRDLAPLRRHPNAMVINTGQLTLEQQVELILEQIQACSRQRNPR